MNQDDIYATKEELKKVGENFDPHFLSKKICDAINSQKDVDRAIRGIIKEAIENDVGIQNIIKGIIYKNWKTFVIFGIPIATGLAQIVLLFIK